MTSALGLERREHIALVGGGGKTSLLFALAEECKGTGRRVVISTTTKVCHCEALRTPRIVYVGSDPAWKERLREGLEEERSLFLAEGLLESGKVQGIEPSLADELFRSQGMDYLFIEADGAAGHPVKAHAAHEPVIPASVTKVVALLGLDALGQPMTPDCVFRGDLFSRVTGCRPGQRLTPLILSRLFLNPRGLFKGTPSAARRVVFLNKSDLPDRDIGSRELAHLILEGASSRVHRVVIGSVRKGIYFITGREDEGNLH